MSNKPRKIRKGTKVHSYNDKTTHGVIEFFDEIEGCWSVKLNSGSFGRTLWPDDEVTITNKK